MKIEWKAVPLPDWGTLEAPPKIPEKVYENRCRRTYQKAAFDWVIVYGDREHFANLAYLTGFDPRFEEALLLLGPGDERILVVGNEGQAYAPLAGLELDVVLCQSFSLLGQDRTRAPRLDLVLREAGVKAGQTVGVVGWKYLETYEAADNGPGFFAPAFLVDVLRKLIGGDQGVVDVTSVLMHPTRGLRATNEVEQIAAFEWAGARATQAVWRILSKGARPGKTEFEAVSAMGYAGEPLSAHIMFASGKDTIIGLRSPSSRRLEKGDGATTAIGYWGGLGCRAGIVDDDNDAFLKRIAKPYFLAIAAWYETAHIGQTGEVIHDTVDEALATGKLRSMLNAGHLTSLDEWVHTPVRRESQERIASGMAFQCDVIPVPMPPGWAINCEDPVVFADEGLQAALRQEYPDVWSRIGDRRAFMREELGIELSNDLLPLSTTPAYLPPLWLSPNRVMVVT